MTDVNETVVRYIAAWNERDPKRRRDLVAETWSEDGSYIDAHRNGKGHGAIDAMLATTQAQFPADQPGQRHRGAQQFRALLLGRRRHRRGAALSRRHRLRHARPGRPHQGGRRLHRRGPGAGPIAAAARPLPAPRGHACGRCRASSGHAATCRAGNE